MAYFTTTWRKMEKKSPLWRSGVWQQTTIYEPEHHVDAAEEEECGEPTRGVLLQTGLPRLFGLPLGTEGAE